MNHTEATTWFKAPTPDGETSQRADSSCLKPSRKSSISAQDAESLRKGLAQLVLQLVNLIRQLMEKQAVRRMPSLPIEKQEQLGLHLMLLEEKLEEMREYFGIEKDEMELGVLEGLDQLATDSLRSIAHETETGVDSAF